MSAAKIKEALMIALVAYIVISLSVPKSVREGATLPALF
jgi:hypothetical protein